jgi:hypothetical protein
MERWMINIEVESIWKEAMVCRHTIPELAWTDWEKFRKISVMTTCVALGVRAKRLPRTCLEIYRYANPLGLATVSHLPITGCADMLEPVHGTTEAFTNTAPPRNCTAKSQPNLMVRYRLLWFTPITFAESVLWCFATKVLYCLVDLFARRAWSVACVGLTPNDGRSCIFRDEGMLIWVECKGHSLLIHLKKKIRNISMLAVGGGDSNWVPRMAVSWDRFRGLWYTEMNQEG